MLAAGESGLCIVIATCAGGQRIAASDDMRSKQRPNLWPAAVALLLATRPAKMAMSAFGGRRHAGAERGVCEALPPFSGAGLKSPPHTNLNVAMDEDDHALEHAAGLGQIRRVPRMSLSIDIFQGDLAAGLPVIHDEA